MNTKRTTASAADMTQNSVRLSRVPCAHVPVEVVGEIVHDVRNVLALVDAALRMAEREEGPPGVLRFIVGARDGIRQGMELTTRLLAAPSLGRFYPQLLDANALLRKLESLLTSNEQSSVRVVMKLAPEVPICLLDEAQFNAAILNLVSNAREASPADGIVIVSTDQYVPFDEGLDRRAEESYLRIRVSDHGRGLTPEILPRIFEPFFTTKGKGTGLGLPQVQAFVHQVGGNLNVITESGAGTTFELIFPAIDGQGEA